MRSVPSPRTARSRARSRCPPRRRPRRPTRSRRHPASISSSPAISRGTTPTGCTAASRSAESVSRWVVASAPVSGADLVLVGDVCTVDVSRPWARAVAVRGDRIVAVGTEDEVRDRVGAADEVLRGACIVPAFQDAHIHAAFAGRILLNLNVDDLATRDAYLERA